MKKLYMGRLFSGAWKKKKKVFAWIIARDGPFRKANDETKRTRAFFIPYRPGCITVFFNILYKFSNFKDLNMIVM